MASKFTISLDKRPQNIQGQIPFNIQIEEYSKAVAEGIVLIRGDFVQESPVGGTGILRNSWITEGPNFSGNTIKGEVVSSVIQAQVVDGGAKRHLPPHTEDSGLHQWVRRKLRITNRTRANNVAFLISRKIKRDGIKAKRTFVKSFESVKPQIDAMMERAKNRTVARLGK